MEHKIIRVIEEYNKNQDFLHKKYILKITPKEIIKTLDDLTLNKDDYEDEIYDPYILDELQIQKLKPYLVDSLNEDFVKYDYVLSCYSENQQPSIIKNVKYYEDIIELNEFDRKTNYIHKHYELTVPPTEIFPYIDDIILEEDDTLEDYELYELTEIQIQRLKPFVKNGTLNENINKYKYHLYHKKVPIYEDQ